MASSTHDPWLWVPLAASSHIRYEDVIQNVPECVNSSIVQPLVVAHEQMNEARANVVADLIQRVLWTLTSFPACVYKHWIKWLNSKIELLLSALVQFVW